MSANKVILNGDVLIDLTEDTVVENGVRSGKTFHKADGTKAVGTSSGLDINGIVKQYKVNAGAIVSAGDFVEFVTKYGSGEFSQYSATEMSACKLDNERVFITYIVSGVLKAIILDMHEGDITLGTETTLSNSLVGVVSATTITNDKVVIGFRRSDYVDSVATYFYYIAVCTIEDTTITMGVAQPIDSTTYYSSEDHHISLASIANNKIVVCYSCYVVTDTTEKNYSTRVRVCTIEDTTVSISKVTYISSSSEDYCTGLQVLALTDSKLFIGYTIYDKSNAANVSFARIAVLEDTTITWGSNYIAYSNSSFCAVTDSKIIGVEIYRVPSLVSASYDLRATVYTVEGTTITKGTPLEFETPIGSGATNQWDVRSLVALSDTKAFLAYTKRGSTAGYLQGIVLNIGASGTSLSVGTGIEMASATYRYAEVVPIAFSDNSVLIFTIGGASIYTGATINGTTVTVNNAPETDGTFVQPATSNLFNVGVAKTSGTAGETVDVYCVE